MFKKDKKYNIKSKNGTYNKDSNDFEIEINYDENGIKESETLIDNDNGLESISKGFKVTKNKLF